MSLQGTLAALAVLAVVAFAVTQGPGEIKTRLVAGPSRLQSTLGPELSAEALDAYRKWSRKPAHYGAFAASDYGHYGWVSDYNDIETAEAAAIRFCGIPNCRVFARSLPLNAAGEGELVVSRPALEEFEKFLRLPGAKAYALHGNGAGGSWVRADSLGSAKEGALRECDHRSRTPEGEVVGAEGPAGCQVVHAVR